jgi:SAM-dependent methyltransferase
MIDSRKLLEALRKVLKQVEDRRGSTSTPTPTWRPGCAPNGSRPGGQRGGSARPMATGARRRSPRPRCTGCWPASSCASSRTTACASGPGCPGPPGPSGPGPGPLRAVLPGPTPGLGRALPARLLRGGRPAPGHGRALRPQPQPPLADRRHRRRGQGPARPVAGGGPGHRPDPDHDFTDPDLDTRFLGDLYQDLSEPVRKKYALLQTPEFVEEFILDRTLTPALAEFGYREVRLIDPTCGSGHFLLGAFRRLFDLWAANEPARNLPDLAQRALDAVYGVDINPYAVAIARFRLTMAALAAAGIRRLADAPDFRVHVAVGDSLLHGRRFNALDLGGEAENLGSPAWPRLCHRGPGGGQPHPGAAVSRGGRESALHHREGPGAEWALPAALRDTCHRQYSLVVPFTERFFDLALPGRRPARGLCRADRRGLLHEAGVRQEAHRGFLPRVDLTHVIATSGAYIPGHGTPTVILFGRNRPRWTRCAPSWASRGSQRPRPTRPRAGLERDPRPVGPAGERGRVRQRRGCSKATSGGILGASGEAAL